MSTRPYWTTGRPPIHNYAETPDPVGDAVKAALGCGKPAVVEIPIGSDEFPTPVAAVRRDRAGARA
jgi:hypothetical protein